MISRASFTRRDLATRAGIVFTIAFGGFATTCALWLREYSAPRIVLLGSGSRLSLLVSEGPARLVLATGDDPIAFENALTSVQPLFARRVDVLLVAGSGRNLLVPLAISSDRHMRTATALASLPSSPEADEIGPLAVFDSPKRIQLGPTVSVAVECASPFAAESKETFPAWRLVIERGNTRVVFLSDGGASGLFPPVPAPNVIAVSGDDPLRSLEIDSTAALIANATAIDGPEMREGLVGLRRPPAWAFRVAPNEALNLRLVDSGVEIPSETAHPIGVTTPKPGR